MLLCPSCRQELPQPPEPFCPHCGTELPAPEAPVAESSPRAAAIPTVDAGPAADAALGGEPSPRQGPQGSEPVGFVVGFAQTTLEVLARPSRFFRSRAASAGVGGPLLYGVTAGYVGVVVSALYGLLLNLIARSSLPGVGDYSQFGELAPLFEGGWLGFGIQVVLGPVFVVIGIFVASGLSHLGLLLLGARQGFEATFRVFCFAQATALFQLVPFCGALIGLPYMVVLLVVGFSEVHAIGEGRAYAGLFLSIVVACCCVVTMALAMGGLGALAGLAAR